MPQNAVRLFVRKLRIVEGIVSVLQLPSADLKPSSQIGFIETGVSNFQVYPVASAYGQFQNLLMLFKLRRSHLTEHKIAPVSIQYPIHPGEPLLHLVFDDLVSLGLRGGDATLGSCRKHTIKETPSRPIYQASIARTSTGLRATASPISSPARAHRLAGRFCFPPASRKPGQNESQAIGGALVGQCVQEAVNFTISGWQVRSSPAQRQAQAGAPKTKFLCAAFGL